MKEAPIEPTPTNSIPPVSYLRECFRYEPDTGKVFWIERPAHHFKKPGYRTRYMLERCGTEMGSVFNQKTNGKPAGVKTSIMYLGKVCNILAHQVGWKLIHGEIPDGYEVDHIDRDPTNNRLTNLRLATHLQNMANLSNYRKKSPWPKGVSKNGRRFRAMLRRNGKLICAGNFDTVEEAHAAYVKMAKELHGEFYSY